MLTAGEAKSLGGIARQIRGLLQGIDQLPEAFEHVEGLEVQLATAKKEKLAIESDTAALKATFGNLDQDYRQLQAQYGELDEKCRARKQQLELTLSTLLADVASATQLKDEALTRLAELKARFA